MRKTSMRSTFDNELSRIRSDIVRMGSLADQAIERAHNAFRQHDTALAQEVIAGDQIINTLRYQLEGAITALMALQAPLAHDLRLLIASLIISNELERIGDHAEGIARTVLRYPQAPGESMQNLLDDMVQEVRRMLQAAMQAYVQENVEQAEQTARMDDTIDSQYRALFKSVVEQLCKGIPAEQAMYLLWAGHNIERIGDRVTNICERVVFARTGQLSREMNPKPAHKEPPV